MGTSAMITISTNAKPADSVLDLTVFNDGYPDGIGSAIGEFIQSLTKADRKKIGASDFEKRLIEFVDESDWILNEKDFEDSDPIINYDYEYVINLKTNWVKVTNPSWSGTVFVGPVDDFCRFCINLKEHG